MNGYIIALDQGTTSSRSIIFDSKGNIVSLAQYPFTQIYPKPGWVEHDPMVILESQMLAMSEAFEKSGLSPTDIAGIGITNQRETTIVWDKNTGKPIYNAIVWQCRRTAPICDQLTADGLGPYVKEKTGLLIDAYFSGTKIKWILDNVPGARERAERGELLFGNVDSWLIWNLTGGRAHVSDYSNCSRTMLFDIDNLCWDEELCARLGVPMSMLPTPVPSSMVYGQVTAGLPGLETLEGIPVCGSAGDQGHVQTLMLELVNDLFQFFLRGAFLGGDDHGLWFLSGFRKPSPSSLRDATSPEGGGFIACPGQNSSPLGGAVAAGD